MNETQSLRAGDIELMSKADLKLRVRELLTAEDGYCKVIEAAKEREAALVGALQSIVDADRSKFLAAQHMMQMVEIAERALGIPHWGTPEREAYEKERQS